MARTVDTERLQNHRSAGRVHSIIASCGARSKMLTRLGQTGYWPKPVVRANHHFECGELTERMIIPFVIRINSVVRRSPQTLANTRVGATVLYGHQGPVPHPGNRGCQCWVNRELRVSTARVSEKQRRVDIEVQRRTLLLSRQVRALRIERSLNE